jgi:apolipoprotein N-acyltransferase
LQGNIAQDLKWLPEQFQRTMDIYRTRTEQHWNSDLIIWPEAAVTLPLNQSAELLENLATTAKEHKTSIITGIPIIEPTVAYNGIIALGEGHGVYHKRHLVPFGEYTPLKSFYGFILQAFNIPMSNFTKGALKQTPLAAAGTLIGPYICYEVAYPIEFLNFLPQANLLVTVTDDSWFGHSLALEQHLQMAQMRALETGRYLLFSGNTGITAVINDKGQVVKSLPAFQEGELTISAQPMQGSTPWVIVKNYPLAMFMTLIAFLSIRRKTLPDRIPDLLPN